MRASVSDHTQVVTRGAAGVKRARLEHGPYLAGRVFQVDKAPPADPRLTARWRDEPEQHPQRRRLARAIRTDEARDAAGPDLKADVVHGTDRTEVLSQRVNGYLKHRLNPV
jgi:hypothetical protein